MSVLESPQEPDAMSRGKAIGYAIGLPLGLFGLLFLPAGTIGWRHGWVFVAVLVLAFGVSGLVVARVNPIIFRARSRFQPGTKSWDKALLAVILPAMVAILPVAALDAGRLHWSAVPPWAVARGYAALLAGIAVTAWAQAMNPFFEPGVRIQSERHQRVIDTGPYRFVRHPGYVSAADVLRHGVIARLVLGRRSGHARIGAPGVADLMGRSAAAGRTSRISGLCPPCAVEADPRHLVGS